MPSQMMCTRVFCECNRAADVTIWRDPQVSLFLLGTLILLLTKLHVLQLILEHLYDCFNCNSSCIIKIVHRHNQFGIYCLCFIFKIGLVYCRVLSFSFPLLQFISGDPPNTFFCK